MSTSEPINVQLSPYEQTLIFRMFDVLMTGDRSSWSQDEIRKASVLLRKLGLAAGRESEDPSLVDDRVI